MVSVLHLLAAQATWTSCELCLAVVVDPERDIVMDCNSPLGWHLLIYLATTDGFHAVASQKLI